MNVQWLYKVARNRAIDELRRRQREQGTAEPINPTVPAEAGALRVSDAVHQALLQLSPDDREVLYLSEVDGFTSVEIGAMLAIRPGAVRMRLYRAHARFRKAYGDSRE